MRSRPKQRVAAIPDVPTLDEAGVSGCESDTWNALTAPPKTPAGVIAKLNDAANKAMKDPELLDRYQAAQPYARRRHAGGDGRVHQGRRHSAGAQ